MKTILKQIKNEWNSNLFLFVELLLVFVVLWYIVDWTLVTARAITAPMDLRIRALLQHHRKQAGRGLASL